jgi:ribosomal protein S18 acetylase RimI-like enzyme
MPSPFVIRSLTLQDLPAYKALRDEALRANPEAFTSDYETERQRSAQSYDSRLGQPSEFGNQLWGAWSDDNALVGSIALEVATRAAQRHIGTLLGLFVAKSTQGQGIASELIAVCADHARAKGQFDQLILTVTASNTHVVRLYEKAGFEHYGLLPRAICVAGVFYDKALMRMDLRLDLHRDEARSAASPDKLS